MTTRAPATPLRVLFLCTGNSARSQMAEAILARRAAGRFATGSAGSSPAPRVHPLTVEVLGDFGIDWSGAEPKSVDAVAGEHWDLIITVCDRAKEACPTFPGRPIFAHWGIPDPAHFEGTVEQRRRSFHDAATLLTRRIDLMLALPIERLERRALELRLDAIGRTDGRTDASAAGPDESPVRG